MDTQQIEDNAASQQRLRDLIARLDEEELRRTVDGDWTVSALLAHLAFWDASSAARWDQFDQTGAFAGLSTEVVDLINDASFPTWQAISGRAAAALANQAAEMADTRVADLSEDALAYVAETGRHAMVDRAGHRNEHLDQIEAVLNPR